MKHSYEDILVHKVTFNARTQQTVAKYNRCKKSPVSCTNDITISTHYRVTTRQSLDCVTSWLCLKRASHCGADNVHMCDSSTVYCVFACVYVSVDPARMMVTMSVLSPCLLPQGKRGVSSKNQRLTLSTPSRTSTLIR